MAGNGVRAISKTSPELNVTREYFSRLADDVFNELALKAGIDTADGVLYDAFILAVNAKYGSFDEFASQADDAATNAIARMLAGPFTTALPSVQGVPPCPVPAHVDYQFWQNDYAMHIRTETFDAAPVLGILDPQTLPKLESGEYDYPSDELFFAAAKFGLVPDHDGPFSCYVDDQDALDAYRAWKGGNCDASNAEMP